MREANFEEKKEYLSMYWQKKKEEENFLLEIEEIKQLVHIPNQIITGLPITHNNKDLSDLFVRLEQRQQEYLRKRYRAAVVADKILKKINRIKDEESRELLIYRHIKCYSWDKICDKLGYSRTGLYKRYRKAVIKFPLKIKE